MDVDSGGQRVGKSSTELMSVMDLDWKINFTVFKFWWYKNMSPDRVTFSSLGFFIDPGLLFSSEVDSSPSAELFLYKKL